LVHILETDKREKKEAGHTPAGNSSKKKESVKNKERRKKEDGRKGAGRAVNRRKLTVL
jgi:hypothetical protein